MFTKLVSKNRVMYLDFSQIVFARELDTSVGLVLKGGANFALEHPMKLFEDALSLTGRTYVEFVFEQGRKCIFDLDIVSHVADVAGHHSKYLTIVESCYEKPSIGLFNPIDEVRAFLESCTTSGVHFLFCNSPKIAEERPEPTRLCLSEPSLTKILSLLGGHA